MRRFLIAILGLPLFAFVLRCPAASNPKALQIYFIDVEGAAATLIVSPSGQSLLVDAGWPGYEGRDADRIIAAAHQAGVKQLDYVMITHYHRDHVGGVTQLVDGIKVGTFVDHGPNQEDSESARAEYAAYQKAIAGHSHVVVKPGWGVPMKDVEIRVLTSNGEHISSPLPSAGQANSYCASEPAASDDPSENSRSLGILVTYGRFRFLDLGDLTKKKELELACPNNMIGTIDLFLSTHHGMDSSNPKALVWALHPRVGVIANGARKGSSAAAWQILHDSPGLEEMWQLHYAAELDKDHNVDADHTANVKENCEGKYLAVKALNDGSFTLTNQRTGAEKTYTKK